MSNDLTFGPLIETFEPRAAFVTDNQQRVRIRLTGMLGRKFGREFNLAVSNVKEAMRALCSQVEGFEHYMRTAKEKYNQGFAVFYDDYNLSEEELLNPVGKSVIKVVPLTIGSKEGGWLNVILGIVLIVVGVVLSFTPFAVLSGPLINMGIAMVIGGVVQLLTPKPKGRAAQDNPENQPGFNFNGPVNTQAQGNPVSVLLGRAIIGSAVLSAGIEAREDSYIPAAQDLYGDSQSYGTGGKRETYREQE